MSHQAVTWAWDQTVKNSTHRLVLVALCDNASGPLSECPGLCWPSNRKIAERCMISERQVKRIMDDLVADGLVLQHRRRRRPDGTLSVWEYVIPYTRGHQRHLEDADQGTLVTEPGDTGGANQGTPMSPHEHVSEPSVNTSLSLPAAKQRTDEVWDAVAVECNVDASALTDTGRKNVGKTVAELKRAGATGDDVTQKAAIYREKYPDAPLTVNALRKHWAELTPGSIPKPTAAPKSARAQRVNETRSAQILRERARSTQPERQSP